MVFEALQFIYRAKTGAEEGPWTKTNPTLACSNITFSMRVVLDDAGALGPAFASAFTTEQDAAIHLGIQRQTSTAPTSLQRSS